MIESYGSIQINVPFSIKRTLFQIFKKSLLNVPFNLEKEGLNIYKKGTYNREQRVPVSKFPLRMFICMQKCY